MTQRQKRVLIVGINPSGADPTKISQSIKRLHRWTRDIGLEYFSFTNCISSPGKYHLKDVDYEFLSNCAEGYDKIVALGNFPSKALSRASINHFTLPHPSGLNRKLNDPAYEKQILEECARYINS